MKTLSLILLVLLLSSMDIRDAQAEPMPVAEIQNMLNDLSPDNEGQFMDQILSNPDNFRVAVEQIPGFMQTAYSKSESFGMHALERPEYFDVIQTHDNSFLMDSIYNGGQISDFISGHYGQYFEQARQQIDSGEYSPSSSSSDDEIRDRLRDEDFANQLMHDIDLFKQNVHENSNFADIYNEMYPDQMNEMFHMHPEMFEILSNEDPEALADLILSGGPIADFLAEHHPEYVDQVRRDYEDSINGEGGDGEVADGGTTGGGGTTTGGDEGGGEATGEGGGGGATPAAANAVAAYCSDGTVLTIDPEMSASKYECNGRIVGYVAKSAESSDSNPFKSLNSVDGQ